MSVEPVYIPRYLGTSTTRMDLYSLALIQVTRWNRVVLTGVQTKELA